MMRKGRWLALMATAAVLAGCATNAISQRKQERAGAYSALTPAQRAAVDAGRITAGMNTDAVYIAWGQPAEILSGKSTNASSATWVYQVTYLREFREWKARPVSSAVTETYLERTYSPRTYTRAAVDFQDGIVRRWYELPQPGH